VLVPGEEASACYPFRYEFRVEYRFAAFGLTCRLTLENLGDEPLPWCAGQHFYFKLPWHDGSVSGDYLIRIPAGRRLRQDASGLLVAGPKLGLDEPMDNPALLDTFHTELRSPEVVFGEKGHPGDVTVSLGRRRRPGRGLVLRHLDGEGRFAVLLRRALDGPTERPGEQDRPPCRPAGREAVVLCERRSGIGLRKRT
jgi:hypothetical protein